MKLTLKERLDLQRTARIITEAQYKKLLNESQTEVELSDEEQEIVDDLLNSLNEGTFDTVIEKIKSYAKKGLMTVAILSSLMASPKLSQAQKQDIKQIAKTEMSVPTIKDDVRVPLNQALKSTSPYVINTKDFMTDVPFTSWNYGANAKKSNATVGLSISVEKGSNTILIDIGQVPGKSTEGYEAILTAAKDLGGDVNQSSKSTQIKVSKDKISDIASFVKGNINNLTK